ncbi:LOW QUALITY PROTEIN: hypothetical protein HID58_061591, partial [Brassica napus]
MARKKVKLVFLVNNSSRKATYKKQKRGWFRKVHEISTLCGIRAGAIIYNPTPAVWPSVDGMNQLIAAFRNMPEIDRQKNSANQQEFLKQRITKADNLLMKNRKDNREVQLTEAMYQCLKQNMGPSGTAARDLNDLGYLVDQFLNGFNRMIEVLVGGSGVEIGESSNVVALRLRILLSRVDFVEGTTAPATTVHGVGSSSSSAAAGAYLFNQISFDSNTQYQMYPLAQNQQQFYQPFAPYAGFFGQNLPMGYAANQMGFPFMDNTHHYRQAHHQPQQPQGFPGESSTAPQQQLFPGESSSAPPPATSGSGTPAATTPNS